MSEYPCFESWFDEVKRITPEAILTDPDLWFPIYESNMTPTEAVEAADRGDFDEDDEGT